MFALVDSGGVIAASLPVRRSFVVASLCVEALTREEKNVGRFSALMFPFRGSFLLSRAAQRVMQYSLKACFVCLGMGDVFDFVCVSLSLSLSLSVRPPFLHT